MLDIIKLPKERTILIPTERAVGLKLQVLRHAFVTYRFNPYIITDYTVEACRQLAAIGQLIPSPITFDYHWPSKYPKPFDHQIATANFMVNYPRSFCFNDIGTSKTLTALWACDYLMSIGLMKRVLIASPLSTLHRVWETEICTNLFHRSCVIIHDRNLVKRRQRLNKKYDFYIINHDGLKTLQSELESREDITHVIIDEGAIFRNQNTQLWRACANVCNIETRRSVTWMTGSPMPTAPTDVWAQAKIVNPNTVPKFFSRFRDQTMFRVSDYKWIPRSGWEKIVYSSIQPSIRYKRADCVDIPDKITISHAVDMSPQQAKLYKEMLDDYTVQLAEGLITASNEGSKLVKLLQIACGAVYDSDRVIHFIDASPKFAELNDIINEVGSKIIIFAPFKSVITLIANWFKEKRKDKSFAVIHGDIAATARNKVFANFQEGTLDTIIAQPGTMAHGLTLTSSNTTVWWGPIDNYEIEEQADGRISRVGQHRKQYIKRLLCSKVEQKIYARNKTKESLQGILLELIKEDVVT